MTTEGSNLAEQLRAADDAVARIDYFTERLVRPEVMAFVMADQAVVLSFLQMLGFARLYGLMRVSGTLTSTEEGRLLLPLLVPFATMVDTIDDAMEKQFGSGPGVSA